MESLSDPFFDPLKSYSWSIGYACRETMDEDNTVDDVDCKINDL